MELYDSIGVKKKNCKTSRKQNLNANIELNIIEINSREIISQLLTTEENFGFVSKIIFSEKNFFGLHQTLVLSTKIKKYHSEFRAEYLCPSIPKLNQKLSRNITIMNTKEPFILSKFKLNMNLNDLNLKNNIFKFLSSYYLKREFGAIEWSTPINFSWTLTREIKVLKDEFIKMHKFINSQVCFFYFF